MVTPPRVRLRAQEEGDEDRRKGKEGKEGRMIRRKVGKSKKEKGGGE